MKRIPKCIAFLALTGGALSAAACAHVRAPRTVRAEGEPGQSCTVTFKEGISIPTDDCSIWKGDPDVVSCVCPPPGGPACVPSGSDLTIRYHYASRVTYTDLKIENSQVTLTYFPRSVAEAKCRTTLDQRPCWSLEDLEIKFLRLSSEEVTGLVNLVQESGFLQLEDVIGGPGTAGGLYSTSISVTLGGCQKNVVYRSLRGSVRKPNAFLRLEGALRDIRRRIEP